VGGLNASTLVGGYRDGTSTRAFRYDSGTLTWLQPLGDANGFGMATGINNRGEVIGQSNGHAVAYANGGVRDLGAGIAKDVNERGIIVGQGADANGRPIAMMYGEVAMPFATPPYSTAIGVSNEGLVVGSGEGIGGWLLDGDTVVRMADMSAFAAAGWRKPEPTGVNDSGSIVGTATDAAGNLRAFVLVPMTRHPSKELRMVEAAR
jgi:probable HAF family extracellular repeat protein